MKITKAQKDAVISLLREKFDEKQKIESEKFYKEHEAEIAIDVMEYKNYIEVMHDICIQLNSLHEKFNELFKRSKYLNDGMSCPGINYDYGSKKWIVTYDYSNSSKLLKSVKIDTPDFCKIGRQLELDTLSKDFDLDKFIQKYLEN